MSINVHEGEGDGAELNAAVPIVHEGEVRRMTLTKEMCHKWDYTENCEVCRAQRANLGYRRGHNERCRKRIIEELASKPMAASPERARSGAYRRQSVQHRHDNTKTTYLDGELTSRTQLLEIWEQI